MLRGAVRFNADVSPPSDEVVDPAWHVYSQSTCGVVQPTAYGVRGGVGKSEKENPSSWRGGAILVVVAVVVVVVGDEFCDRRARLAGRLDLFRHDSQSMLSRLLLML